jgi:hypothetical protein
MTFNTPAAIVRPVSFPGHSGRRLEVHPLADDLQPQAAAKTPGDGLTR